MRSSSKMILQRAPRIFALMACLTTTVSWSGQPSSRSESQVRINPAEVFRGLPASVAFYPAFHADVTIPPPTVAIRSPQDADFGVGVKIRWSEESLMFSLDVHDPTAGVGIPGGEMWRGDSIQLAVDTEPDTPKTGYTDSCYELGFALSDTGDVLRHAWQVGGYGDFDPDAIVTSGKRRKGGWRLDISIPWSCISRKLTHPPRHVGVNVLVNDGNGASGRRYVEWTPATGVAKAPDRFARVSRVRGTSACSFVHLAIDDIAYEADDTVAAQYVEYVWRDMPKETCRTIVDIAPHLKPLPLMEAGLPPAAAGSTRRLVFSWPAGRILKEEGHYYLACDVVGKDEVKRNRGQTPLVRLEARTRNTITDRLATLQARLRNLESVIASLPGAKSDSYVRLGAAVARRFLDRVQTLGVTGGQPGDWSLLQLAEVEYVIDQTGQALKATRAFGPEQIKTETYRGGFGHFDEVAWDLPFFSETGFSLVQQQRGPCHMKPDGSLHPSGRAITKVLDAAEKNNVKVDLFLAPHNFPGWAVSAAPDLTDVKKSGFMWFNVDHPKARDVMKRWIEMLAGLAKNHPAVFSICLSNEPTYCNSGLDKYSRPAWGAYLKTIHGSIETLNTLYGTGYKTFEEVPVPETPQQMPKDVLLRRAIYDWTRFNCLNFAEWHRWMNDIVKRIAPNVPTHAKIMPYVFTHHGLLRGIDPELICGITDLAGNDCDSFLRKPNRSPYAYDWQKQGMWYDLLHSFRGQDVFNSENHPIRDNSPAIELPPSHIRSVLWHSAMHHLSATTIWAWFEPNYMRYQGLIAMRPATVHAAGRMLLDLNRLAEPVRTLGRARPSVAILYSIPSVIWQGDEMKENITKIYTALMFSGQPATFVSERHLASGNYADVDWIIVPQAQHVSKPAVETLEEFAKKGGQVIFAGRDNLAWDEYHRKRNLPDAFKDAPTIPLDGDEQAGAVAVKRVLKSGGLKMTDLQDEQGRDVWGVEYRSVPYREGILVSLVNFNHNERTVKLNVRGEAVELLSRRPIDLGRINLASMEPMLLEIGTRRSSMLSKQWTQRAAKLVTGLTLTFGGLVHAQSVEPFELSGWKPEPARRTVWTRWLNTFDFRNGAGDPDYYRGIYFMTCRPSNYRAKTEGRFGIGAPVYAMEGRRTQMTYHMDANCPSVQGTVELFVRSRPGMNIWNDGKDHVVFNLFGGRGATGEGNPTTYVIKTKENQLALGCQGNRISLPVDMLQPDRWYHVAASWDSKVSPGRLWLTIDGKGVTGVAEVPLRAVKYGFIVFGNWARDPHLAAKEPRYGESNVARLTVDKPEDKDIAPLDGIIDEIRISDETLADRTPQRQAELAELPVDWDLYRQVEDAVRMILYRLWPNDLPLDSTVGGKYGGIVEKGFFHLAMYEAFGDQWFLDQAQRVGKITLMAQRPEGHFLTGIKLNSTKQNPQDLGPTDTGIKSVGPSYYAKPNEARIQDGFQDIPMAYLIYLYRITGNQDYLNAALRVGEVLMAAQNPNGSWSGLYDVSKKKSRIADNKRVWQGGEFDDGANRRPFWSLVLLHQVTGDRKYLEPLRRCADWILKAEIVGSGARGWAGFYDAENKPVWARRHEPPKIYPKVFPYDVGRILMWTHFLTGDRKYLDAIRPTLKWYQDNRMDRGWYYYYNEDGTQYVPDHWPLGTTYFGPEYGHFEDITYIALALKQLDKSTLMAETRTLEPTTEAMAAARADAVAVLKDPELMRWVKRDVQLTPNAQWVRYRPRYDPDLYGLQAFGDLEKMLQYLLAVRIAADKVPPSVSVTGAPVPDGTLLGPLEQRCWFAGNWFAAAAKKK